MSLSVAARRTATALLLPAAAYASTKESSLTTSCDANNPSNLRKRMTSIGRFSHKSETASNPSVPTMIIALSGTPTSLPPSQTAPIIRSPQSGRGMSLSEFSWLWNLRSMFEKHPRFSYTISTTHDGHFEQPSNSISDRVGLDFAGMIRTVVSENMHFQVYRKDLAKRMEDFLCQSLDVTSKLFDVQISSGPMGSSGAISKRKAKEAIREGKDVETVVMLRTHHVIGDGVSLGAALSDLSDEAEEIQEMIREELQRRGKKGRNKSLLLKVCRFLQKCVWFWFGSIRALTYQGYLLLVSRRNPFQDAMLALSAKNGGGDIVCSRSVSWCDAAPVEEVKRVASILSTTGKATINDVFVSCVSAAIAKQLKEHQTVLGTSTPFHDLPSTINIVIPVHLMGGISPPGQSMGNRIGAMVARVPGITTDDPASDRLTSVASSLTKLKGSPAPLLGYLCAKLASDYLPTDIAKFMMRNTSANSVAVISNVRGSEKKMHWNGRTIESVHGFLPLPPGVPIGVVVHSYAGVISLTVNADKRAVPDADVFLGWVLEEYVRLADEARCKMEDRV